MSDNEALSREIESNEYLRQRFAPRVGDPVYLHLSDLRIAMDMVKTDACIKVLDFGCGGSPYRQLFSNAEYRRADYLETSDLDYIIRDDAHIDEADESFDIVLSTQVLEHVRYPAKYLAECLRLLKPGGKIICTTHGTYEEHGCPHDYQRWTADGLAGLFTESGFSGSETFKLTTGPRAALFLLELYRGQLPTEQSGFGAVISTTISALQEHKASFHTWCDKTFGQNRIAVSGQDGHQFYICLMITAFKPAEKKKISRYEELFQLKQRLASGA